VVLGTSGTYRWLAPRLRLDAWHGPLFRKDTDVRRATRNFYGWKTLPLLWLCGRADYKALFLPRSTDPHPFFFSITALHDGAK